jgi:hypothetical protein
MVNMSTPMIDEIIMWNQKLIGKEYLNPLTGKIDGRHAGECILPSKMGLNLQTLSGRRQQVRTKL